MNAVLGLASRITGQVRRLPAEADLAGYMAAQTLARSAVAEVASLLTEGWSEKQAARLLNTCLMDHGVRSFFHKAFAWYGERTRFEGVGSYFDYLPGTRVVRPGEVFILDVAPIVDGYICDIGCTGVLGVSPELDKAQAFLAELREDIPAMFEAEMATRQGGAAVWRNIDERIEAAGYANIHALYPFSVLGHRVHKVRVEGPQLNLINFGWQSYFEFLSRGLFGQLLNGDYSGDLKGLWAIEPHIGGVNFGAKFEEILVVDDAGARWLDRPAEPL